MTGLRQPPKRKRSSRILVRLLVLILLVAAVVTAIWTVTTRSLIETSESLGFDQLTVDTRLTLGGTTINVVTEEGGPVPVVLLHDFDISGGIIWDDVVGELGDRYHAVRVDLPGFGLSDRHPEPGPVHTVASMAGVVAALIESDLEVEPVLVGVGLGGEVAAELAVTRPGLVRGLVLVDVDFWETRSWLRFAEQLPWVGDAVMFTFETGGRFSSDRWAPQCGEGGWCPSSDQLLSRETAESITGSTASMQAHLATSPASLVPSDLGLIELPAIYVWSSGGEVPSDSRDQIDDRMGDNLIVVSADGHRAHLDDPEAIADAIEAVDG